MTTRKFLGLLAAGGLTVCLTGCPTTDTRTSNQGGGSLITAGAKVLGGEISNLTPDELQIAADTAADVSDDPRLSGFALDDDDAAAIVEFLEVNGINTVEDIQRLADNPDALEVPESLQTLIDGGAFDQF